MGDLKKKKVDYIAKTDDGEEILIDSGEMSMDEHTVERLRSYIKRFYEMQMDKQSDQDKEGEQ